MILFTLNNLFLLLTGLTLILGGVATAVHTEVAVARREALELK